MSRIMIYILMLTFLNLHIHLAHASEGADPTKKIIHGKWIGDMVRSGLRRSIANETDLGELSNRSASYTVAELFKRRELFLASISSYTPQDSYTSEATSYTAQGEIITPIQLGDSANHLMRVSVRSTQRFEEDLMRANSNRVELGIFQATVNGYFGTSLVVGNTDSSQEYVDNTRSITNYGLRVEAGKVFSPKIAASVRLDHLWINGQSDTNIPLPLGNLFVHNDVNAQETYFNTELIVKPFTSTKKFTNTQWRSGVHCLYTRYERTTDNFGDVVEPLFGDTERLCIARTGVFMAFSLDSGWSPFGEIKYDYEFVNNMNSTIDDPNTVALKVGVGRLFRRSFWFQFDAERYDSLDNQRQRNAFTLSLSVDF